MRNWPGVQLCIDPITITGCGTDDDEFFLLLLLNTLFIHLQLEVSSVVGGEMFSPVREVVLMNKIIEVRSIVMREILRIEDMGEQ